MGLAYDRTGGGLIDPSDLRDPTTNFCWLNYLQLATLFSRLLYHSSSVNILNCYTIRLVYNSSIFFWYLDCCILMRWFFLSSRSLNILVHIYWKNSGKVESSNGICPFFSLLLFSFSLSKIARSLAYLIILKYTFFFSTSSNVLWAC